jgi:hypothetical protein
MPRSENLPAGSLEWNSYGLRARAEILMRLESIPPRRVTRKRSPGAETLLSPESAANLPFVEDVRLQAALNCGLIRALVGKRVRSISRLQAQTRVDLAAVRVGV